MKILKKHYFKIINPKIAVQTCLKKILIYYYVGEEYQFSFTQFLLNPSDKYVDSEEMQVTYTEINGYEATVVEYKNKDEIYILWNDGEYAYQIFSSILSAEDLIRYAVSVK